MDSQSADFDDSRRDDTFNRFGASLVNVVLGALILWVGQTTFHHAGELASVNERFKAIDSRHENIRQRIERATSETAERTRLRFTSQDGDKMAARIKELHDILALFERQITQRVNDLRGTVIALETNGSNNEELAVLRSQVERLRFQIAGQSSTGYYNAPVATKPTYLPPVNQRR